MVVPGTPEGPEFEIVGTEDGSATTLAVHGEVDLVTAPRLQAAISEALMRGPVVVDVSQVTFMDSSGVRVLDSVLRYPAADGRFTLRGELQEPVRQILVLTGMLGVLPFETTAGAG